MPGSHIGSQTGNSLSATPGLGEYECAGRREEDTGRTDAHGGWRWRVINARATSQPPEAAELQPRE